MGNPTETLPSAGSEVSDEALLQEPQSPSDSEALAAELEPEKAPDAASPEQPDEVEEKLPEGETGSGEEETDPDLAAGEEGEVSAVDETFVGEVPEDIKAVFAQEEVGPKIRDLYYRDAAYREVYPTVADARAVKELLPDGLETAKELIATAERIEPFEESFEKAIEGGEGATHFWQTVWNQDQTAYHNLHTKAADNVLDHYFAQAEKTQDKNLKAAVQVLRGRMHPGESTEGRPQNTETSLRENHLVERENALASKELNGFKQSAFEETETKVTHAINAHVNAALAQSNVPIGAKKRIAADIHEEIRHKISSNPTLQSQLNRAFRKGNRDEAHRNSIVSIVVSRAKALIPETSRPIFKEWTGSFLTNHTNLQKRQETSRADVGVGGAPGQRPSGLPEKGKIDYSKVTDAELLGGAEIPLKQ